MITGQRANVKLTGQTDAPRSRGVPLISVVEGAADGPRYDRSVAPLQGARRSGADAAGARPAATDDAAGLDAYRRGGGAGIDAPGGMALLLGVAPGGGGV
ncbi:MAG: hypothetical protein HUU17_02185 [Chthonomonadales bacterium]|nr:hypothetical protein [Chthonomonadales bacterium]